MKRNFATQKEAKSHAARMAEERELRGVGDPHRHSTGEYLKRWLAHLRERGDHAPTTLAGYHRHAAIAAHHIGHIPLAKLGAHDLDRLYAALRRQGGHPRADGKPARPLSPQSVMHVHRLLHTALGQARKWKLIAYSPASDATAPSVPFRQARGYTATEITQLLDATRGDAETAAMLALLLVTGLRRSELLGLALDALDLETGTISVRRAVTEVRGKAVLREIPKNKSSLPHAQHSAGGGRPLAGTEDARAGARAAVGRRVLPRTDVSIPRHGRRAEAAHGGDGATPPDLPPRQDCWGTARARLAALHPPLV